MKCIKDFKIYPKSVTKNYQKKEKKKYLKLKIHNNL